jgi:hypothetical protein
MGRLLLAGGVGGGRVGWLLLEGLFGVGLVDQVRVDCLHKVYLLFRVPGVLVAGLLLASRGRPEGARVHLGWGQEESCVEPVGFGGRVVVEVEVLLLLLIQELQQCALVHSDRHETDLLLWVLSRSLRCRSGEKRVLLHVKN